MLYEVITPFAALFLAAFGSFDAGVHDSFVVAPVDDPLGEVVLEVEVCGPGSGRESSYNFV